jgi:hypothetical protein
MEKINYSQIYAKLTKGLSPKTKDIFDRRFGVKTTAKGKDEGVQIETLESIGKSLGITRERVRQIEEVGFNFIKKNHQETLDKLFSQFRAYFNEKGGFKREEVVLSDLGDTKNKPYVLFLLTLGNEFARVCGKKDYHYFWVSQPQEEKAVKETLNSLVSDIEKHGSLLTKEELSAKFASQYNLTNETLASYLEISKKIQENKEGKLGLIDWPEIKPRGVKDKAFLVFKKEQKPLHFREITTLIDGLEYGKSSKKTHPQTVHNELIKDKRFVLVGRGTYALSEWGYVPGTIKDIIAKVLKEKPQLVSQDEIVKEVLSQRLVAKNTVLINLNNKKYFTKDSSGKYFVQGVETV